MTIEEIKKKIAGEEYDFLRTDKHLENRIILLGLGGSYSYGTNVETSDLDVRGIALNTKAEILTNERFEQFENKQTDTTIYGFNKIIKLLSNCNPNTIELLGLNLEHYLYVSSIGYELLDNSHLFLSKKAAYSFQGFIRSQARRIDNKAVRTVDQEHRENHVLNSIYNAMTSFPEKYFRYSENSIKLYLDDATQEDMDKEIFMDVNLKHYPLRDYQAMWAEMHSIVKDYAKLSITNRQAVPSNKLNKHMMHLVRLYYMCFDILENEKVVTYREKEHDLLMNIRNGEYLDSSNQPIPEFFEMVDVLDKRLEYDKKNTSLSERPNYDKINEFVMSVNERVVKDEI